LMICAQYDFISEIDAHSTMTFKAVQTIISNTEIGQGKKLSFSAAESIELQAGFTAEVGTEILIEAVHKCDK